jgi:nucleoside 2-deoxyribosyltransferase
MKVYLCGGIHGLSNAQAKAWRERATELLSTVNIIDPMRRDYRGAEASNIDSFIEGDLRDIAESDVLLVNATRPSWGTAMEIVYAHILHRRIVAFVDSKNPVSPWLRYHCDEITISLEEAVAHIKSL